MKLLEIKSENDRKFLVYKRDYYEKIYTEKMLLKNDIAGLVDVRSRNFNGELALYYDVTGLRLFSQMFQGENDKMEVRDVKRLAESFFQLSESIDEYLLDIKEVCISPDMMFYSPGTSGYEFIYLPGRYKESAELDRGLVEAFREVWDRVIEKFDYKNHPKDLVYIYGVYQKICSGNSDIKSIFEGYESLSREGDISKDELSSEATFNDQEYSNSPSSCIDSVILEDINKLKDEDKREDKLEEGKKVFLKSNLFIYIKKAFLSKLKVIAAISCGISILIIVMLILPTG